MDRRQTDTIKSFERSVARFISENALPEAGSRLIVGMSGGADSTALVAVLKALGYEVIGAHCNYRLRGEESDRDRRRAIEQASELDIELHVRDFDVGERMRQSGESVEMACRWLRYHWFESLLEKHRARAVAVGHHREDNAETLLLNLLRGTGTGGLGGIRARRDYVVRPLLDCTRADIEAYLRARGIAWVDDSSNAGLDYARNRVRHQLLPAMEELSPGAMGAIVRTARNVARSQSLGEIAIERMAAAYMRRDDEGVTHVDVAGMCGEFGTHAESVATTLLFEIVRRYGFGYEVARSVTVACGAGRSGLQFANDSYRVGYDHGRLGIESRIESRGDDVYEVSLARDILSPVYIEISEHSVEEFNPRADGADGKIHYMDFGALSGGQFVLRHWRRGDRIRPFGMGGKSKLVSDIFAAAKLSQRDKEKAWLLCRGEEVLWVLGLRSSESYAVSPATRRYLRLRIRQES